MDGWFDPSVQGDDLLATTHEHSAASDALVVGRSTFEEMAGYWPKQSNDKTGITSYLNEVVYPALQGYGRRLFPDGQSARLTLMDSTAFDSGAVLSTYRIA
jgi:hypothetical protein